MSSLSLSVQIWSFADVLRGDYKQSVYGRVTFPFTVLRQIDSVLVRTKGAVLAEYTQQLAGGINP